LLRIDVMRRILCKAKMPINMQKVSTIGNLGRKEAGEAREGSKAGDIYAAPGAGKLKGLCHQKRPYSSGS